MEEIKEQNSQSKTQYVFLISVFVLNLFWFLYLKTLSLDSSLNARQLWGASYQVIALIGGIMGFYVSKHWGGFKSVLGKVVFWLSLGLIFQCIGQSVSSFYNFFEQNGLPYPSFGDIGFFGSTICYIIAAWFLMRASGLHLSFKSVKGKILSIITPIILLAVSYQYFLKGYQFDFTQPVKVFLDLGYPIGDAIYVSLAVIALVLCQKFMGGIMKSPIRLLIFALLFQYIADFTFLYQSSTGVWSVGGVNDLLYCTSYFLMTLSIIRIGQVFEKIKSTQ